MAIYAAVNLDFQGMGVMAFVTTVERFHMLVAPYVSLPCILIRTLCFRTKQRSPGGKVVDVQEAQTFRLLVIT